MERKALFKKNNSLWSVSRFSHVCKLTLGRYNLAKNPRVSLSKSFGFTLIELITVIAVLSILATLGIAALDPFAQYQKSTDARKKSDLAQIQRALEVYYGDASRYPENPAIGNYRIKSNDVDGTTIDWGSPWQPYMNILPKSPDSTTYVYYVDEASGGQSYYLYANLGRGAKDPQACNSGSACQSMSTNGVPDTACGEICNYGISSSNVSP
jgi:general secretion pathway protein G